MENVIEFNHVWKNFRKGESITSLRDAFSTIFKRLIGSQAKKDIFWALKDVSFDLKKGQTLGIIGPNGAGKTTILKLIAGIMKPNKGELKVNGRISSLIEVGAGFHPDLTGRENIYLNGSIMGMSRVEISKKFDAIVDFAGIGSFLDTPVKRYSSGMYVRLGFAVAVHTEPELLLVDEILAVGDVGFRRKCYGKISQFKAENKTIIFVSHNLNDIKQICDQAICLIKSRIFSFKDAVSTVNDYLKFCKQDALSEEINSDLRWGSGEARIEEVVLLNENKEKTDTFQTGDNLFVSIKYNFREKVEAPNFWVAVMDENERKICGTTTRQRGIVIKDLCGVGQIKCVFKDIPFVPGLYSLIIGIYGKDSTEAFDRWGKVCSFQVVEKGGKILNPAFFGVFYPQVRWEL